MKASIRDRHVLESVRPLEMAAYLRSMGWRERETIPERVQIWESPDQSADRYEVQLPRRQQFLDYAAHIADLLATLEVYTDKPQLQLLNDLSFSHADVVRIRAISPATEEGTISLLGAATMVQKSLDLMLAAASSTALPRAA